MIIIVIIFAIITKRLIINDSQQARKSNPRRLFLGSDSRNLVTRSTYQTDPNYDTASNAIIKSVVTLGLWTL